MHRINGQKGVIVLREVYDNSMGKRYRINEIYIHDRIEAKLLKKKPSIRIREIYQILEYEYVKQVPDNSKGYGFRLVVYGRTYGGRCLIMWLYPEDMRRGCWNLATAREANENEKKRYFQ